MTVTYIVWLLAISLLAIVLPLFLHKKLMKTIDAMIASQNHVTRQLVAQMKQPAPVHVNFSPLEEAIKSLPTKVLHSIQSSVNTKKGSLGELIGYIELEAKYDRIIPLGNIVDFMCIKFPSAENEGYIDFVDIKTGSSSRLSKDQKMMQQLIRDKQINFIKLTVNTQANADIDDSD